MEREKDAMEIRGDSEKRDGEMKEGMDRVWKNKNRGEVVEVG